MGSPVTQALAPAINATAAATGLSGVPGIGGQIANGFQSLGSGLSGGVKGALGVGIDKPQLANIQSAVTPEQIQGLQGNVGNSLASQQALLSALQNQNGIAQQNNVSSQQQNLLSALAGQGGVQNQTDAMSGQRELNSKLAAANGVGTQMSAISGLQNLANQQQGTTNLFADVAAGKGPNPAQAALNNATGANVANQAALMAGQRGAGANVGLMARQAAQQGAGIQQQAVGQSALQQAQQQLGAMSGLVGAQQAQAGTQQAIGGLGTTQVGQLQGGIGQQQQMAAQQIAQQQAQQQMAAQQANAIAQQQIAAQNAYTQANLANLSQSQQALASQNQANVSSQGSVNAANAGLAGKGMEGQQAVLGGVMGAMGPAAAAAVGAQGGDVMHLADGTPNGVIAPPMPAPQPIPTPTPAAVPAGPMSVMPQQNTYASSFGSYLDKQQQNQAAQVKDQEEKNKEEPKKEIDNKGSPLKVGTQSFVQGAGQALAGAMSKGGMASSGGPVKAKKESQKAVESGDSYSNDRVPAMLSEGEVVIPRSVMQSGDPVRDAADFVQKVLAKRKARAA